MAVKNGTDLRSELRKYRVPARPYAHGKGNFKINISGPQPGTVYYHEGRAEIEVIGDKEKKQVVLKVEEAARETVRTVHFHLRNRDADKDGKFPKDMVWDHAHRRFPIAVPNSTFSYEIIGKMSANHETTRFSVRVTAKARAMKQAFLVGMDETHNFISALPSKGWEVKSVDEAHKVLRPDDVSEGAQRQGEWFFDPISKREAARVNQFVSTSFGSVFFGPLVQAGQGATTHRALQVKIDNDVYVSGAVIDTRQEHHAPLLLTGWHKVRQNRELAQPRLLGTTQRRRSWD